MKTDSDLEEAQYAARARALDLNLGTVRSRIARARAALAMGVGLGALPPPSGSPSDHGVRTASLRVFDPVPPGGLCAAAGLCNTSKEQI